MSMYGRIAVISYRHTHWLIATNTLTHTHTHSRIISSIVRLTSWENVACSQLLPHIQTTSITPIYMYLFILANNIDLVN